MTTPATEATRLLEQALHLRQAGERAPGGTETWQDWDLAAEAFLRRAQAGDHTQARDWLEATIKRETADLGSPTSRRNALTVIMGAADTYAARAAAHASREDGLRALAAEMLADGDDYVDHYGRRLIAVLDGNQSRRDQP